ALAGVVALVVADEHDLMATKACQAALDGGVVAEEAIAVEFAELPADHLDIVLEERPLRVAGDLHGLPGAKALVRLAEQGSVIGAKLAKLFRIIRPLGGLHGLELLDLLLQFGQWFFKFQNMPRILARGGQ